MNIIINPQAHYRPSDYISHPERLDAKGASQFAKTLGLLLTMQVECKFPFIEDPISRLQYSRAISHKLRMFASSNHYQCAFISARSASLKQTGFERVDYLVHVPEVLGAVFAACVSGWFEGITVKPVSEEHTVRDDGKNHSSLNFVLRAIAPETRACESTALDERSGRVWGPRLFITRNLWVKNRINHRRMIAEAQLIDLAQLGMTKPEEK